MAGEWTVRALDKTTWPLFAPEPAGAVPAGFLFNGALTTFEQLGFRRERMIGKHRWVVSRVVDAA